MDNQDDNEQAKAYERASFDHATYIEFANIVHHFDDTARPAHDDIDFNYDHEIDFDDINIDSDQFDATEYDHNGLPVTLYGIIIYNFLADDMEEDPWNDYPENYDVHAEDDDYNYGRSCYRFPYYDPREKPCERPRATHYDRKQPGVPPI